MFKVSDCCTETRDSKQKLQMLILVCLVEVMIQSSQCDDWLVTLQQDIPSFPIILFCDPCLLLAAFRIHQQNIFPPLFCFNRRNTASKLFNR